MTMKYSILQFSLLFPSSISGLLCDLDVQLNKRSDIRERISRKDIKTIKNDKKLDELDKQQTFNCEDEITRIKGCATMWHENSDEICEMLKSIFRMDEDYCAR